MQRVAEGIAASAGCTVDLDYHTGYPPTINTADEVELSANAAEQIVGAANLNRDVTPLMGAEDFSYVLQQVPGAFAFVGFAPEGSDPATNPPLHNTRMQIEEAMMAKGVALHCAMATRFLEHGFA